MSESKTNDEAEIMEDEQLVLGEEDDDFVADEALDVEEALPFFRHPEVRIKMLSDVTGMVSKKKQNRRLDWLTILPVMCAMYVCMYVCM
jgi:hypothetical protein